MMADVGTVWLLAEVVWLLVGLFCFVYQFANTHRSRIVRDRNRADGRDEVEIFLTEKRYVQELTLLYAGALLLAASIGALIRPNPAEWSPDTALRLAILAAILLCQVALARHSEMVHTHHHQLVSRLTSRRLRRQYEARQLERRRDRCPCEEDTRA